MMIVQLKIQNLEENGWKNKSMKKELNKEGNRLNIKMKQKKSILK